MKPNINQREESEKTWKRLKILRITIYGRRKNALFKHHHQNNSADNNARISLISFDTGFLQFETSQAYDKLHCGALRLSILASHEHVRWIFHTRSIYKIIVTEI